MKAKMSRCVPLLILVFLGFLMLSASSTEAQQTVRFWHSYTQPERVNAMKEAAAEFEKATGTRVEIEVVPWGRMYEKWTTGLAAKTLAARESLGRVSGSDPEWKKLGAQYPDVATVPNLNIVFVSPLAFSDVR